MESLQGCIFTSTTPTRLDLMSKHDKNCKLNYVEVDSDFIRWESQQFVDFQYPPVHGIAAGGFSQLAGFPAGGFYQSAGPYNRVSESGLAAKHLLTIRGGAWRSISVISPSPWLSLHGRSLIHITRRQHIVLHGLQHLWITLRPKAVLHSYIALSS